MDKKVSLKLWALQKGYASITDLAKGAGISRAALYQAIRYKPGHGNYPPIGEPALHKLALALDLTDETIKDWYNGRVIVWTEKRNNSNA